MKYSDSQRQTDRSFCKSQTGPAFGLDRDKYNNYRALPDNAFTAESDRVSSFAMPLSRMTPSLIALCGKNPVQYPPRQTSYPLGSPKNRLDDHLSEGFASARLHISLTHNALKNQHHANPTLNHIQYSYLNALKRLQNHSRQEISFLIFVKYLQESRPPRLNEARSIALHT